MAIALTFLAVLAVEITSHAFDAFAVQAVAKSLLMPTLAFYFLRLSGGGGKIWTATLAAVSLSWLGDVVLLFASESPAYFFGGLIAFLAAHVAYSLTFILLRSRFAIVKWPSPWTLVAVAAYATAMYAVLAPSAAGMAIPIAAYASVIGLMLITAIAAYDARKTPSGKIFVAGAILFLVSDSILGISRFAMPIPFSHSLVMITYGAAQVLLVHGIAATLNAKTEHAA